MKFNVISLFPEFFKPSLELGVVGQAVAKQRLSVQLINPRQFTEDVHQTVDDRPFGGGDGMVMMAEPLAKAVNSLKDSGQAGTVVYLSAQGQQWTDQKARQWASEDQPVTLICGRYGGVDQRFIDRYVDEEISIGDYVLSGGELGAQVLIDSVARFVPGVLGNEKSSEEESFAKGILEAPLYTRPRDYMGQSVPEFLLSGNHSEIAKAKQALGLLITARKRPDLLAELGDNSQQLEAAEKWLSSLSEQDRQALKPLLGESPAGGFNV